MLIIPICSVLIYVLYVFSCRFKIPEMIKLKPKSPNIKETKISTYHEKSPTKRKENPKINKENEPENEEQNPITEAPKNSPKTEEHQSESNSEQDIWDENGKLIERKENHDDKNKPKKKISDETWARLDPLRPHTQQIRQSQMAEKEYNDSLFLNPQIEEKEQKTLKLKQFLARNEELHQVSQNLKEKTEKEEQEMINMKHMNKKSAEILENSQNNRSIFDVDMKTHKNDPTNDYSIPENEFHTPKKNKSECSTPTRIYDYQVKKFEEKQAWRASQSIQEEYDFTPVKSTDPHKTKILAKNARERNKQKEQEQIEKQKSYEEEILESPSTPKRGKISKPVKGVIDLMKEFKE